VTLRAYIRLRTWFKRNGKRRVKVVQKTGLTGFPPSTETPA
jgi:hypothetical protein